MIEQTSTVPVGPGALQLPPQAAPIDRSQAPLSAVAAGGGVEAAFGFGDFMDIVKVAGPLLGAAISDRRRKLDIRPVKWGH